MTNLDSILKSKDITLPTRVHLVKAMVFPVVMYGCESWTVKKAEHRRIDAFELWCWRRLSKNSLDCKEIQPVHSEGDQPWMFFGRNDAEAETPVLWPPRAKSWLIGKDSDAEMDWGQEEKGTTEDEMAGWHHWLDGQGNLACCDSWGRKESDMTEWLNWTELNNFRKITPPTHLQAQLTWSDFQSMLNEKSKMQNSVHTPSPVPERDSGRIYVLSTLKVCRRIHKYCGEQLLLRNYFVLIAIFF